MSVNDPTTTDPSTLALDRDNISSNGTIAGNGASGTRGFGLDLILIEVRLVLSAMGIIYLGAHAALRRPPSATLAKKGKGAKAKDDDDRLAQGLLPSDAILFPLMAGVMLVGLYYIIQWLQDPAILNKILQVYMSTISLVSLLNFYKDGLELLTSLVFPRFWRGFDGHVRKASQRSKAVQLCDEVGNVAVGSEVETNPLPGMLSLLTPTESLHHFLWRIRWYCTQHFVVKTFSRSTGEDKLKLRIQHAAALTLAISTAVIYFSTKSPTLSNILGYGFCYGSFLLLSPTDLLTASLVLVGLFCYDIVMVFYTPYMITVATTLDVPIKLQFKAANRQSILGLGDIVVPGMVIAWALRLDLWLHYIKKVKYEPTEVEIIEKDDTGSVVRRKAAKHKEIRPIFADPKGLWGEKLWLRRYFFLFSAAQLPPEVAVASFSKPYFHASMIGYFLGMLATLAMLLVFKRGQPALLYLVPGVLSSLFITGVARGEFKKIWNYTEDGSIDHDDMIYELDGSGRATKALGKLKDGVVDTTRPKENGSDAQSQGAKQNAKADDDPPAPSESAKDGRIFSLSLELPPDNELQ